MSFSIMIIAATGLALANTAGVAARCDRVALRGRGPERRRRTSNCSRAVLKSTPGVISVEAVPEKRDAPNARALARSRRAKRGPARSGAGEFRCAAGHATLTAIERRVRAIAPGRADQRASRPRRAAAALDARDAVARVRARAAAQRRGRGRGRARRARSARHASLHDRGDARDRRDRRPGDPAVPAQDRDRRAGRQHSAERIAARSSS